ncbi:MAG: hypothetical protein B9S33_22010 [Pedosphaera sp. Tous-C6FEB]|nr:MAG: hypothetical protein B9S33_22010 [Pedosphaera sp. Tous-C6FEB]
MTFWIPELVVEIPKLAVGIGEMAFVRVKLPVAIPVYTNYERSSVKRTRWGLGAVRPFSLTPALSRWEREKVLPRTKC